MIFNFLLFWHIPCYNENNDTLHSFWLCAWNSSTLLRPKVCLKTLYSSVQKTRGIYTHPPVLPTGLQTTLQLLHHQPAESTVHRVLPHRASHLVSSLRLNVSPPPSPWAGPPHRVVVREVHVPLRNTTSEAMQSLGKSLGPQVACRRSATAQ